MDREKRNKMIEENIPLAKHIVKKIMRKIPLQISAEDLMQEAFLKLVLAVDSYDDSVGVSFSSFAFKKIHGGVIDFLRKGHLVRKNVRGKDFIEKIVYLECLSEYGNEESSLIFEEASHSGNFSVFLDKMICEYTGDHEKSTENLKSILYYREEGFDIHSIGSVFGVSGSRISQILSKFECFCRREYAEKYKQLKKCS
jgi:RNA polymerase sigma factor (sigma-70 family)